MDVITYIQNIYLGSNYWPRVLVIGLMTLVYFIFIVRKKNISRFMIALKLWLGIFSFVILNVIVFFFSMDLLVNIIWGIFICGLNTKIWEYIRGREMWTFQDLKKHGGKKEFGFISLYIGFSLYWIWTLYLRTQIAC